MYNVLVHGANPIGHNVCVSAVVPCRSRVLSHETKTLNEDKTINEPVTAPLQKHFVVASWVLSVIVNRSLHFVVD